MTKSNMLALLAVLFISTYSYGQTEPFEISIEPISISGLGGLQSYSFGQHDGKWLIVGGRLDGLHRRQPWAAFDIAGHNNQLIVIDPITQQQWSAPLTTLPTAIQEQLSSTNMEFYQEGDYLYCLGGYGYSATADDHITFANLTAIKVPDVINAIISNTNFSPYFRQITDAKFQVTGGRLQKINATYYLLGGQKFMGRYNPMGPDHGPGFFQEYTDAIRKFNLADDGTTISITHLPSHIDEINLHRRDYNAEAQILPNGDEGITMFSGVFQHEVDLPFLNSVSIDSIGYTVNNDFQQHYNHYHCPVLTLYSGVDQEMHTVFFGGIAQFYDQDGILVQDDDVPFVKTIARVTRDANGDMVEYKLPIEMPALLGAGGEFISSTAVPHFKNEVFKLDSLTTDPILIGYIFGGISSSQPNIFFINEGEESDANSQIFKIFINKPTPITVDVSNLSRTHTLNLKIFPNPNEGTFNVSFNLPKKDDVTISLFDMKGILNDKIFLENLDEGESQFTLELNNVGSGNVYQISLESSTERVTQKLILKK